jgi:hypothetical protein
MKHPSILLPRSLKRKMARRELVPMNTRTKKQMRHALIVARASILLVLAINEGHEYAEKFFNNWVNFTHDYYCLVTRQET